VSFTLVDLDGDGKRDLIIDSYVGGTGLFSYTGILKRSDDAFAAVNSDDSGNGDDFDAGVPGALYSLNGRGANQWSHWVRINGQVMRSGTTASLAKIISICCARLAPQAVRRQ
jgi:hypothetical protein